MRKLLPAKVKYRKCHKGRNYGNAKGNSAVAFGGYGIKAISRGLVNSNHIDAARKAVTRCLSRKGKVWIKIFPQKPVTKKPAETRMGKGKGPVEYWAAVIKPGNILFEISGVPESLAREALRLADAKLPVRCRYVTRND